MGDDLNNMESAQARVQDAVTSMVNSLDRTHIRKIQHGMYQCSMKCCENESSSMEEVQHCLDRCSQPVTHAQSYFQQELSTFQNRLQRCAMDCQDQVRDKLPANATESDIMKHKPQMETCSIDPKHDEQDERCIK